MLRRVLCAFALASALVSGSAAATDGSEIVATAADFGAPPAIAEMLLSPDGNRVAQRGQVDGRPHILITDLSGDRHSARSIAIPAGQSVEWLRWAGNDRLLFARTSSGKSAKTAGGAPPAVQLVALDLASGKQTMMAPGQSGVSDDSVIHINAAGRFLLLRATASAHASPAVYRVDLATGAAAQIVAPQRDVWDWYADSAGVVRAGMGEKGNHRWLLYRAGDGDAFRRSGRGALGRDADQLVPVAGSDQGYATAIGKDGRAALYHYNFATNRLGALVYEAPHVDIDTFQTSPNGDLLGVTYTDGREKSVWFDSGLKHAQAQIDALRPGAINRIVSMDDDRGRLLVWSGSATDPGSFYLFDVSTKRLELIAVTHETLRGKQLSPMDSVSYKARDGLKIPAFLTLPAGHPATGLPLIVMPHGGPFVHDDWGYDPWVQYLASKGYAVLQPNYRGSTGFGQDFVEAGNGQWGRGMQNDVDDGVKWLAARGTIDSKRVCIMGASYGGYAAEWAAVRDPDLYRCAISFAGISDIAAQLDYDRKGFESARAFRAWQARIQGNDGSTLAQLSPLTFVDKMTVPILIAHGTADTTVPFTQSEVLHQALLKLKRDHEYLVFPGADHGLEDPKDETEFLTRVGAFLDKHNPS